MILSIVFTSFFFRDFCPDTMILCTMIPIPKDKGKSLFTPSNYMAIALKSIFGQSLDWVILIKEQYIILLSELQFGLKNVYQQHNVLIVFLKQLITIILISLVCMFGCWMQVKLSTE